MSTPAIQRTFWNESWSNQLNHYGEAIGFQLHPGSESYGDFVGSRTEEDRDAHAPLLDLDFPVTLLAADPATGLVTLLLGRSTPQKELQDVQACLVTCGFAPDGVAQGEEPALSFSVPVRLVPSSTEGHFHLYIEAVTHWKAHEDLLDALYSAGIIERNYHRFCKRYRMGLLRREGVQKAA